jgi:hypothetical protein
MAAMCSVRGSVFVADSHIRTFLNSAPSRIHAASQLSVARGPYVTQITAGYQDVIQVDEDEVEFGRQSAHHLL